MPLELLYLDQRDPDTLEPLWGAPVSRLNIGGRRAPDLGPLGAMPLRELSTIGTPWPYAFDPPAVSASGRLIALPVRSRP